MEFKLVYTITEGDSWRSTSSIKIKSNLADDKLIDCQIAESLVEHLKTESAMFDPDKLLLGFAEAQKRGIKENLEALTDIELQAKNFGDSIQEKLLQTEQIREKEYEELSKSFTTHTTKFNLMLSATTTKIQKQLNTIKDLEIKLQSLNAYKLETLTDTLETVLKLIEKDPELTKIVFNSKFKEGTL